MASRVLTPKKRYVPDLNGYLRLCEQNYRYLLQLLPELYRIGAQWRFFTHSQLHYQIEVLECSRYSTLVRVEQLTSFWPGALSPRAEVRLYHDAQLAEVVHIVGVKALQARYDYPNTRLHQSDEKYQQNRHLHDWLQYCLQHGQVAVDWQPACSSPD